MEPAAIDMETSRPPNRRWTPRKIARLTALFCLVVSLSVGGFLLKPFYSQNIGIVDPGRVIRSAQPTSRLDDMIREYELASILSLRGGSPKNFFYANEVRATNEAGVSFYDLPLSATRRPKRRELLLLIDVLNRCEYPLLIHCKSGADRTGLASGIYRMEVLGQPPEQAKEAFTVLHSHVPWFGTQHLHEPFDEYGAWLARHGLAHAPGRFREWVKNDYRADDPSVEPPPLAAGPRRPFPADGSRRDVRPDHSG